MPESGILEFCNNQSYLHWFIFLFPMSYYHVAWVIILPHEKNCINRKFCHLDAEIGYTHRE